MFDRSDDTRPRRPRRVEVFTGPERRREWSREEKLAIVAESLSEGVNVSEIARRHQLNPQQLFGWRKSMRAEAMALAEATAPRAVPAFAPLIIEALPSDGTPPTPAAGGDVDSCIEIMLGSATVRIRGTADGKTLAIILKALRGLA